MKSLLLSLAAAAALSGCAYYGEPYYGYPGYYGGVAYPGVSLGFYGDRGHRDFPHGWRDSEGRWRDRR